MGKNHGKQGIYSVFLCALGIGGSRMFLKKSLIISSFFVLSCPVWATPTEYSQFPTMTGSDYMKEDSVYKNAAVSDNMLGVTSGTIYAVPLYYATSCSENQYLTTSNTCENCPNGYPNSAAGSTAITQCYKMVDIPCTQNNCTNPDTSKYYSVVCAASCNCTGGQYTQYTNSSGTGNGAVSGTTTQSCTKNITAVTCKAGYYQDDTQCKSCSSSYPNSDDANRGGASACYRSCSTSDITGSSAVSGIYHQDGTNNCAATSCGTNRYLSSGTCPACNVSFSDAGYDATSTGTCANGTTTKANATATSQYFTRTCYHQTSNAGSTSSSQCTGKQNCGSKTYGTCSATSCSSGYYMYNGSCNACTSVANNTETETRSENCDIPYGSGTRTYTVTCNGYHTGGAGGTSGSSACTGCSSWARTSTGTCYVKTCNTIGYQANADSTACDPIKYTIVYNANATGATGTTARSTHTYNEAKALTSNGFTNGTKKFLGWSTSSTSTIVAYTNEQSVSNLTTTNGTTINLYAVWGDCTACNAGTGANCTLSAPVGVCTYTTSCKDGYNTLTNGGTYNPKCTPNTYIVVYNANATGATGTTASSTHTYGVPKELTGNGFTNGTKKFLGWSTSSTSTTVAYTNEQSVSNLTTTNGGTVNLYAVWGDCTACSAGTGANCTLFASDGVCRYRTSCKDGYHGITNNGAYNPSCTPNTYTVVYNANATGATGTTATSFHTYDVAKVLTSNGFTNGRKKFLGWSADSSATTPTYTNGQSVSNLTTNSVITLYAVWGDCTACDAGTGANCTLSAPVGVCTYTTSCKDGYNTLTNNSKYNPSCAPNTYTVVYNANATGATGTTSSSTHTYGTDKALTANGFTNGTKKFLGWATSASGAKVYDNGASVSNLTTTNGDTVRLYAVWGDCTACSAGTGANCTLTAPAGVCTYTTSCKGGYYNITNNGAYNPSCSDVTSGYYSPDGDNSRYACTTQAGSSYTASDDGRDEKRDCYRSCVASDVAGASAASGTYHQDGANTCVATSCAANHYLSSGTCPTCNVSFTDSGTDTSSNGTCPSGTTKSNATATSQTYTRTCYHQTSNGGNISSSSCTGTQNCGDKSYGTCTITGCEAGYYLSNGACVAVGTGYYSAAGATDRTKCPDAYPNTDGTTSTSVTSCYATKTATCVQNACSNPNSTACKTYTCATSCSCTGSTYKQYSNASGNGDGITSGATSESCTKAVASVTANSGYYVNGTTCSSCPAGWPNSATGNSTGITACYKTVTRGCTQNPCTCQGNSTCTCSDCNCAGGTYTQYVAADGVSNGTASGTTTNETCNQTVASTTCKAGYYMKNNVCTACEKGTYKSEAGNATSCTTASDGYYVSATAATSQTQCPVGYRDGSNNGRDDITDCYKTVTRECVQNVGNTPNNCQSVTSWNTCECTGETYKRHVATNGTSEGEAEGTSTSETCTKTPKAVTAKAGFYVNGTTCSSCPAGWPNSATGNNTGITACYKTVTRGCTQNPCTCQGNSTCTCSECECAGETYTQYVAANGTTNGNTSGITTNETCDQTVLGATCKAGYYMKNNVCAACEKGTYKSEAGNATSCTLAAEGYFVSTTAATSQTRCPSGMTSPQGTTNAGECGKLMYVGNNKLYLTSEKQTSPALAAKIDGVVYYAKTTPVSSGAKPMNNTTNESLRTKIDGVEYSIHDNTVQGE